MKTILIILCCFLAPIVAYAIYAFAQTIFRYRTDKSYRARLDHRKEAKKRLQKQPKKANTSTGIFSADSETMKAALGE